MCTGPQSALKLKQAHGGPLSCQLPVQIERGDRLIGHHKDLLPADMFFQQVVSVEKALSDINRVRPMRLSLIS